MTDTLDPELAMFFARAGITPPPGREAGLNASFRDLRAALAVLHGAIPPAAEPACTYTIATVSGPAQA